MFKDSFFGTYVLFSGLIQTFPKWHIPHFLMNILRELFWTGLCANWMDSRIFNNLGGQTGVCAPLLYVLEQVSVAGFF